MRLCLWFHEGRFLLVVVRVVIGGVCASGWVRELIVEGRYLGMYTSYVHRRLKCAVILFIISEGMFFFSFFWAYCHFGFAPGFYLGCR